MPLILFIPSNDTQAKMFLPIVEFLPREVEIKFLITDEYYKQRSMDILRDSKYPVISLKNNIFKKDDLYNLSKIKKVAISIWLRKQLSSLLNHLLPELIVLGNDCGMIEFVAIKWAKKNRVPSLLVQDGIRRESSTNLSLDKMTYLKKIKSLLFGNLLPLYEYGCGDCDKIAVMGAATKRYLISKSVHPDSIHVTGQPRYDSWPTIPPFQKLEKDQLVKIVYANQPFSRYGECSLMEEQDFTANLVRQLSTLKNAEITVKLHPRSQKSQFIEWFSVGDIKNIRIVKDENIYNILKTTNLLITVNSTTALEAIALGIPVVIVDSPCSPWGEPYTSAGVAKKAYNLESLPGIIKFELFKHTNEAEEQKRRDFIDDQLFQLDGNASNRVSTLILEMIPFIKKC